MAELGAGNGSGYPGVVDTDNTLESAVTGVRFEVPNDLAAAIIAIQTELGTNPAGSLINVVAWLQTEHNANGTHSDVDASTISVSGIADFSSGSAAAPSIAHTGDLDNGIFFGTDIVGFAIDGGEAARFDASKRFLAGHTTAIATGGVTAQQQLHGTGTSTSSQSTVRYSNDAAALYHIIGKSRGALGTPGTTVVTGDLIGRNLYVADDGTDLASAVAEARIAVEGTIAGNRTPGNYKIFTATNAAPSVITEAVEWDSAQKMTCAGDVAIAGACVVTGALSGNGISIGASTNFAIAGVPVIADSTGTATLSNIDALDATTEATIEAAIDTLANLTSVVIAGTANNALSASLSTTTTALQPVNITHSTPSGTTALGKGIRMSPAVASGATLSEWRGISFENNIGTGTNTTAQFAFFDTDYYTTGGNTPTMGTNCPGTAGDPDQWLRVNVGGTVGYIPIWT